MTEYKKLTDEELKNKTNEFKDKLKNGSSLNDILPEAFAVCREASKRVLGMRHFDVQLIGGIILHQGRIAEMKTGEGKTLVATFQDQGTAPTYGGTLNFGAITGSLTDNDNPIAAGTYTQPLTFTITVEDRKH